MNLKTINKWIGKSFVFSAYAIYYISIVKLLIFMFATCLITWILVAGQYPHLGETAAYIVHWELFYAVIFVIGFVGVNFLRRKKND